LNILAKVANGFMSFVVKICRTIDLRLEFDVLSTSGDFGGLAAGSVSCPERKTRQHLEI